MKTQIRKIGNSAGAILPAVLLKKLRLSEGDEIEITEDGNRIIIAHAKRRYSLEELLKVCDENAPMPADLDAWAQVQPVGRELL